MPVSITPPGPDEYAEFHKGYVAAVAHEPDGLAALERQHPSLEALRRLSASQSSYRYAEGKWTVREMVGHLADAERVMAYRLLRVARGDKTPLPGFDENAFVSAARAEQRGLTDLVDELVSVRQATLTLVRSLDHSALAERSVVNNWPLSARGLVFIIAGHFAHHVKILRDRYGIEL
ncbi:MAG TPA: DinB family protein [Vicinamibacterales bacterium]|nr:DinB family protein [Vicinamibacterales bacterium]